LVVGVGVGVLGFGAWPPPPNPQSPIPNPQSPIPISLIDYFTLLNKNEIYINLIIINNKI
jgi:hypothetical protein